MPRPLVHRHGPLIGPVVQPVCVADARQRHERGARHAGTCGSAGASESGRAGPEPGPEAVAVLTRGVPAGGGVRACVAVLALSCAAAAAAAALPDPFAASATSARAYLVVADGQPLWGRGPDTPQRPASLTKLMTALLVDERLARGDDDVTIPRVAAAADGTRLGLRAGEHWRASTLLTGMLVRSANDACLALAAWVAGDEATFVARMNARAEALGLAATHFDNACGFDAPGQRSSAADLAVLGTAVMASPRLAAIVRLERATLVSAGGRRVAITTTNALLGRVPGVVGVKTGYTHGAGSCLVAVAERDGRRVTVVVLGGSDRWWDAVAMIEQAFATPRR
ncbi:MAG: D-alanyl-D-alanine carboxypeptidase [Proteobacteria bacterium]|nr:D-alanyl-D-alanine carboxypeptidase [Pseudomonadota bacterium]